MQNTQKSILQDIALALTDHDTFMSGSGHFVDLTTGDVTFIQSEYKFDEDEITEEEINEYNDWEQECIRTYLNHDLIQIEPIHSSESFHIMEDFAETRSEKEQRPLYNALNRRHPFSNFRYACEDLGILQEWYDFKNEAEEKQAEEWLEENGLEIKDGKIIKTV